MDFLEKIKRMTTSLSEKRRNKGFKKSFTLVEAAIYLMLVGVLTTAVIGGAALVEKAKLQKVIEDIDYYEKAFVQFTIQFGQAPGTLTLKRCEENIDVFKKCMQYQSEEASNLCSDLGDTRGQLMFAPLQLQTAGFIKTSRWNMQDGITTKKRYQNYSYEYNLNSMTVHYNKNARADYHLDYHESNAKSQEFFKSIGDLDYYTKPRNLKFFKQYMLLFYENHVGLTDSGWNKARDGLFSPKMMEKIDKKFDDGLPRSGKIHGIKNGTISDETKICHNRNRDQDEKNYQAKYINSSRVKQGCDLLYYLPDVSGYIAN